MIISNFYTRDVCVDSLSRQFIFVTNFQKLDTVKLDELLMCDDIWDDVLYRFDNFSDCLECFNLYNNELAIGPTCTIYKIESLPTGLPLAI